MGQDSYLIPANSKKSMLYLSLFTLFDLIVFCTGIVSTVMGLLLVNNNDLKTMLLVVSPALITGFLVIPIPNYHNMMTLIWIAYNYFTKRRKYIWKGWCAKYGDENES